MSEWFVGNEHPTHPASFWTDGGRHYFRCVKESVVHVIGLTLKENKEDSTYRFQRQQNNPSDNQYTNKGREGSRGSHSGHVSCLKFILDRMNHKQTKEKRTTSSVQREYNSKLIILLISTVENFMGA